MSTEDVCKHSTHWLLGACLILLLGSVSGFGQSNAVSAPLPGIRTNFISDAPLSSSELNEVISLAKQCGIRDVSEVETFYCRPGSFRGISVKSKERVDGRNITYHTVFVDRTGWAFSQPSTNALRQGNFWVNDRKAIPTLLREYEFEKQTVRIIIGEGVSVAVADKVIPLIVARKVRFVSQGQRTSLEELLRSAPAAIARNISDQEEYELYFCDPEMRFLTFKLEKEEVIIFGFGYGPVAQYREPFLNPNGILSHSPGLVRSTYPGSSSHEFHQPKRGQG